LPESSIENQQSIGDLLLIDLERERIAAIVLKTFCAKVVVVVLGGRVGKELILVKCRLV